jgi:hypothetical protein
MALGMEETVLLVCCLFLLHFAFFYSSSEVSSGIFPSLEFLCGEHDKISLILFLFFFVSRLFAADDVELLKKLELSKWKGKMMMLTAPAVHQAEECLKLTLFATSHHFVSLHLSPPFLFQICLE